MLGVAQAAHHRRAAGWAGQHHTERELQLSYYVVLPALALQSSGLVIVALHVYSRSLALGLVPKHMRHALLGQCGLCDDCGLPGHVPQGNALTWRRVLCTVLRWHAGHCPRGVSCSPNACVRITRAGDNVLYRARDLKRWRQHPPRAAHLHWHIVSRTSYFRPAACCVQTHTHTHTTMSGCAKIQIHYNTNGHKHAITISRTFSVPS